MKKLGKMGKGGMLKQAMAAMQGKGGGLPAAGEMDPAQMEAAAKQLGQMPGMGKLPGLGGMGGLSGLGGLGGLGGFGKKK
jgi:signal recognition particle subunit SRP54